ncbi:hypothetical protein TNCV_2216431 [Trichonephila clavipes]|nr:hypothetical protein TNCV_2216431 [Trichonephila clavipes]
MGFKGDPLQAISSIEAPITVDILKCAKRIYTEHFWSNSTKRIKKKCLLHIPKWPRDGAAADFQIATTVNTSMISIAHSPICKLCDSSEEMDAIHLALCHAVSSGSMGSRYWEARHKMCDL